MFRDRDGWRVQWTDIATAKRHSRKFDSKGAARLFEAELKQGVVKTPAAAMTFREFSAKWLEGYCRQEKAESQWSTDESAIRVHLTPELGDVRLGQLKPARLEELRRDLRSKTDLRTGRQLGPKTVNLVLSLLKKMLATAVRWGYLEANPAAALEMFPLPELAVRYWTPEERDRFLRFARSIDPAFWKLATVACFTGLRRGELAGLQRHQLHFDKALIEVSAVYCFRSRRRIERTKNRKIGWVPMTAEVLEALGDQKLAAMTAPVFDLGLVRESLRRLQAVALAAGVRVIRFHDLRHTYASSLVAAGVDLYRVQRLMRHETAAMTQRYAHLSLPELHEAAARISARGASETESKAK